MALSAAAGVRGGGRWHAAAVLVLRLAVGGARAHAKASGSGGSGPAAVDSRSSRTYLHQAARLVGHAVRPRLRDVHARSGGLDPSTT